ncbi:hypothetical protein PVAG01_05775 [Phlyctema vagabunda]|uniref:Uncharacterized protein n=1 Tax=Phlyctema vagabunda TaxID=108571 RepID=A0ABR4PEB3_9HELO
MDRGISQERTARGLRKPSYQLFFHGEGGLKITEDWRRF